RKDRRWERVAWLAPVCCGGPLRSSPRAAQAFVDRLLLFDAEHVNEKLQQAADLIRPAAIIDHLAVSPRLDKAEAAQFRQMLGEGGVAEMDAFGNRADGQLSVHEVTHDGEPLLITHKCQESRCRLGVDHQLERIHRRPVLVASVTMGAMASELPVS